jgi:hypothetical protein
MKTSLIVFAIAVLTFISGCDQPAEPEIQNNSFEGISKDGGITSDAALLNFVAVLSGSQEVPPVETRARGTAIFQLNADGTELSYKLVCANIRNITQAHIHIAPAGENGPVVAWLYPSGPPSVLIPGMFNGVLAEGTITAANLVGPLAGLTLNDLLDAVKAGNAYANIHTTQNPGGEIRGQIAFGNGMVPVNVE